MSPLLLPFIPLLAAGVVVALRSHPRLLGPIAVGALLVTGILGVMEAATEPALHLAWSPAIELTLAVTGFGRVMVVLVPLVAAPIVGYAAATERDGRTRLLALLLAFVSAMLLLVVAGDFVTLLLGWELVGATSWALIGHGWRDRANSEAGTQAFLTTRLGDLGLYVAAGATLAATGSFAFGGVGIAASPWREMIAGGVILAAAAKSAQLPFSPWLFAAMAGPTPVSALLHSATLVAAGAYLLVRLSPMLSEVWWFLPVIAIIGAVTAVVGGVVAIAQTHAKRVLAASTSAQYGLMFIAVGAGSTAAAGAQLVTHAAFKSLLFLAAGVAIHAVGTADLRAMRLGRALPGVAVAAAIGALALAGVPPLGGAWSKEAVLSGAVEASGALASAVLVASLLTAVYAGRFVLLAFGRGGAAHRVRRPGAVEMAALAVLAAATVVVSGLWLPGSRRLVEDLTGGVLAAGASWEIVAAVGALLAGGLIVAVLNQRGRLADVLPAGGTRDVVGDWLGLPSLQHRLVVQPTLALAASLARADDRVIDAGVRATGRIAILVAGPASRRLDVSIDRVVVGIASSSVAVAGASRRTDDLVVDGAVEATGRAVGRAGHESRRLQTGLTHHYFVIGAVGLVAIAAILAAGR
ncbi:MAG: NADH-quinone oxidoreductase subunit 5 family protein [Candidatus Limnocylindrales bacterium]